LYPSSIHPYNFPFVRSTYVVRIPPLLVNLCHFIIPRMCGVTIRELHSPINAMVRCSQAACIGRRSVLHYITQAPYRITILVAPTEFQNNFALPAQTFASCPDHPTFLTRPDFSDPSTPSRNLRPVPTIPTIATRPGISDPSRPSRQLRPVQKIWTRPDHPKISDPSRLFSPFPTVPTFLTHPEVSDPSRLFDLSPPYRIF